MLSVCFIGEGDGWGRILRPPLRRGNLLGSWVVVF